MDGKRRIVQSINPIGFDAAMDRMPVSASMRSHVRVLPRPLRMAYRSLRRFFAGDVNVPRHLGSYMTVGFFAVTLAYGAAVGGHLPQVFSATTTTAGLSTDQVRIEGTQQTTAGAIAAALQLDQERSLVGINVAEARQRLLDLPWVKAASIVKNYPASIDVKIEEHEAFAIWKNDGMFYAIEKNGAVIVPVRDEDAFDHLPLILGDGAAEQAAAFLTELADLPEIAMQISQISRVADQRWDVQLVNGVTVMLPENGAFDALVQINAYDRAQQLLARDIVAIDMRVPDRMALRLSPEAALEHEALIEARKRAEKRVEEGFSL